MGTSGEGPTDPVVPSTAAGDPDTVGGGDNFGGGNAGLPERVNGFIYTGEPITDAEAAAYFADHLDSVLSSLIASGVNAWGARIRYPGYCPMTLGETGDVRRNFRDYQLWVDGSLVAIVTLTRLDGQLYATPSFGAPWFDGFSSFLRQHAGEKLLFFYNGYTELVLTPSNVLYAPLDPTLQNPGLDYETLYCDEIAFVP